MKTIKMTRDSVSIKLELKLGLELALGLGLELEIGLELGLELGLESQLGFRVTIRGSVRTSLVWGRAKFDVKVIARKQHADVIRSLAILFSIY